MGRAESLQPVRIGLVGCGRVAERGYGPAFRAARGVELAAVADRVSERCARVAPGVPAFEDAAALLDAARVDALVLATPVATRLADARLAAEADVCVLLEKPPAADADEARALATLDPAPRTGFNRRFERGAAELRDSLPDDGAVELSIELVFQSDAWAAYGISDDVLLDVATHAVDLALWLARADALRVRAAAEPRKAELELELDGGPRAVLRLAQEGRYRERVAARTADGRVTRLAKGGVLPRPGSRPLVESLTRQLEAFAAAVRGEPAPTLGTADDGVAVMTAIDAARASVAAGGAWQDVRAPVASAR